MTLQLALASDRKKKPTLYLFEELTFDEIKQLSNYVLVVDLRNTVSTVKVTSIKQWKRRPNDLDINYKYGLYTYGTIQVRNQKPDMTLVKHIYDATGNYAVATGKE